MKRGNDRTCDNFFRVILSDCSIARYVNVDQIGACINHQVFSDAVRFVSVLPQSWNCRGLVDLSGRWEHRKGVSCLAFTTRRLKPAKRSPTGSSDNMRECG